MKSIWRIVRFTSSLRHFYIGVSLLSVLVALSSAIVPILSKIAIDRISAGRAVHTTTDLTVLIVLVAAIFLCDFLGGLINNINGYYGDILSIKLRRLLSDRYYAHLLSLPQRYYDTELTGKIINRLSRGVDQLTDYMQFFSNNFLQLIFSTIFSLVIVAYYSWPVAIILFLLFPVYGYLATRSSGKWQAWQKDINLQTDIASGRFAESVSQVKVVKSFVREASELNTFHAILGKVEQLTRPQSRHWHKHDFLRRAVLAVMFFAMYLIIFLQTARGVYGIGTLVLLVQFTQLIRLPLFSISFYIDRTQRAIANTKDYFAVMDEESEIRDQAGAKALRVSAGEITFDAVDFAYVAKQPVLHDLSFTATADSKLALVGESGEGKTTITNLLLRLYEVNGGHITIDGQDISKVTQASLRENIAVVFQEPALFSGTVRENIAYGKQKADDAAVQAAAKAANAHEFIAKFDKGYDTEIGERGLKLSGGQKQRIAIARALLKDAPILILDEATSSLDTKSERKVQQALERLMHGRTTLIIAHRLSTIQTVDTVVTLRNGRADEIGPPAELARSGGIYGELLALQQAASEADVKRLAAFGFAEKVDSDE